jgi:hypothetical protein
MESQQVEDMTRIQPKIHLVRTDHLRTLANYQIPDIFRLPCSCSTSEYISVNVIKVDVSSDENARENDKRTSSLSRPSPSASRNSSAPPSLVQ